MKMIQKIFKKDIENYSKSIKYPQNRIASRGSAPGPRWGAYSAPKPPAVRTRHAREHFLLFQL